MCLSTPDIPAPPPPLQEAKTPELNTLSKARRAAGGMAGGTLLTGPSGVTGAALNTAAPTLLGG
jgi:hypothetical protein